MGALKQKIEASLCTLYWGFKKIPFKLYTYVLAKILQNGAKFIQKLTPGFTNGMRKLQNFRQAVESPKECKFLDFPLLVLKFTNSSCHFSNKSQFFFNVWIIL